MTIHDLANPLCLECGKAYDPPPVSGFGAVGYARRPDGARICYRCAADHDRDALTRGDRIVAYLTQSGSQYHITTWPGEILASVYGIPKRTRRYGFNRSIWDEWTGRATMPNGTVLSWRGLGPGMYCRVRALKGKGR